MWEQYPVLRFKVYLPRRQAEIINSISLQQQEFKELNV